jgi:hypothetical protein
MKLTKDQRFVLAASLHVFDETGMNTKPITVALKAWRPAIVGGEFAPSYARYAKQMFALEDAGIIVRPPVDPRDPRDYSYAFIDPENARAALAAGHF